MSQYPLVDDRQIILENLLDFSNRNGFGESSNYVLSLFSDQSDKLTLIEFSEFYQYLKKDIQTFYDDVKSNLKPESSGYKFADRSAIDCKLKIDFIHKQKLTTKYSVSEIAYMMRREHSSVYETLIKHILQSQILQRRPINQELFLVTICLGGIVLLYAKGTLSTEGDSPKRDNICKPILRPFDGLFCPMIYVGNGDDLTYHMKNSICHGHVYMEDHNIRFRDRHGTNYNEFSVPIEALIDGYVVMMSGILGKIGKHSSIIGESVALINSSKRNNEDAIEGASSLLAMLEFMMLFEKFKTASRVVGLDINKTEKLEDAIELTLDNGKICAKGIRNSFSHDFEFKYGEIIIIDNGKETEMGLHEWLYASSVLRISEYVLFFEMMFQAQR